MAATAWNKTIKEIYGGTGQSRSAATLAPLQGNLRPLPQTNALNSPTVSLKKTFCRSNGASRSGCTGAVKKVLLFLIMISFSRPPAPPPKKKKPKKTPSCLTAWCLYIFWGVVVMETALMNIVYHSMLKMMNGSTFVSCLPPPLVGALPPPRQQGSHHRVRKTICSRARLYGLSRPLANESGIWNHLTGVTIWNKACIHVHASREKRTVDN